MFAVILYTLETALVSMNSPTTTCRGFPWPQSTTIIHLFLVFIVTDTMKHNKFSYTYIYIYIYIQSCPKRLTHYDFWKIIAFGSKNGFKMGDQCYHMLLEVPLNISRSVLIHWPNIALWSIHIISTQNRGVKTPLFNFVCDFLESWPSHTCFDYS